MRILLVEDSDDDALAVRKLIAKDRGRAYALDRVETLAACREVLDSGKDPDVILLDLNLPDSDGIETLRSVVGWELRSVAIVVLTGTDDEDLGLEALGCGAQDYFYKGIREPGLLLRVIRYASERKEGENRLRESEARFRSLVDNIPGVVYRASDGRGRPVAFLSDAVQAMTGYSVKSLMERPVPGWHSLVHPDDRQRAADMIEAQLAHSESFDVEYRLFHQDGTTRWVMERGRRVEGAGPDGESAIDGFLFDITDRKRAQKSLTEAKLAAEASSRAKSVFIAKMSHEVRTPLNIILGFAQLHLQDTETPPSVSKSIVSIYESGSQLLSLVNEIVEMARIEDHSVQLSAAPVCLGSLVGDLRTYLLDKAEAKGLDFELQVDEKLPDNMLLDGVKVQQILLNLLRNAIRFTDEGYVTCRVDGRRLGEKTWRLTIEVRDSGIGIGINDRQKIFRPFEQTAPETFCEGKAGLGLSICAGYLDLMGGTISVESAEGSGSTFRIRLDVLEAEEEPSPDPSKAISLGTGAEAEKEDLLQVGRRSNHPPETAAEALEASPPAMDFERTDGDQTEGLETPDEEECSERGADGDLSRLPQALMTRLRDAATACDRRELRTLSMEVDQYAPPIAEEIRRCASAFRYDKLRAVLEA